MLRYQVRFERTDPPLTNHITRGVRTVVARDEAEAIARVRVMVPGSFGHWINGNATECV